MTPEFAAALDERVLAGSAAHTPARRSSPVRRLRLPTLYKLAPVAAVAAAAIAVVIGTSGGHKSQTASYALKTGTTTSRTTRPRRRPAARARARRGEDAEPRPPTTGGDPFGRALLAVGRASPRRSAARPR